jgi:hemerythrin superfamily protein
VQSQDFYLTEYADDVVAYLVAQHDEVRDLLGRVQSTRGDERQQAFDEAREALARHEAAEEAVLRPLIRAVPDGDREADERTEEEERTREALALIEQYDVDSVAFETQFRLLSEAVLRHAEREEQVEFPLLRRTHDPDTLRRARVAVEQVEAGRRPQSVGEPRRHTFAAMLERARQRFGSSG